MSVRLHRTRLSPACELTIAFVTMVCSALVTATPRRGGAQAASAPAATWTIAPAPSVRIGASEAPDELLTAPSGATRLPNGNVVVGDLGDWALREFTPQGRLVKRYGRKGKGPGEISYLSPLMRCGDTLVANDIAGPHLSVFGVSGQFVRVARMKSPIYRISCHSRLEVVVMGW